MLSPFAFEEAEQLGTRAIEGIGIDVDAIDVVGQRSEAQGIGEPVREIVGAEMETQARRNKVEIESRVTEARDTEMEFVEIGSRQADGESNLKTFAEVEALEGFLAGEVGVLVDEVADDAAEVGAERGDGGVVADVESGELFGEGVAIGVGENPLGEVVRKAFGEVVVTAEGLIGVMKNGGIGAMLEAVEKLRERAGRMVPDLGEIGDGEEFEWGFGGGHGSTRWTGRRRREFRAGPSRVDAHDQGSDGGGPSCERS